MLSLPPELRDQCISYLSRGDLCRLSLVCRRFRSIAQAVLFQHYDQPGFPHRPSVRSFLRVLLSRPDLAQQVKHMDIYAWTEVETNETSWAKTMDATIQQRKEAMWSDMGEHLLQRYEHQNLNADGKYTQRLNSDKDLILLLSLTPALESLSLVVPMMSSLISPLMRHACYKPGTSRLRLDHMRTLQVDHTDEREGTPLKDVVDLINLPALSTLRGHKCSDGYSGWKSQLFKPQSVSIQHIDLVCSVICDKALCDLVVGCKTLKTFRIAYGSPMLQGLLAQDYQIISDAFQPHKDSLESLVLDLSPEAATMALDETHGQMNLQSFKKLHHVNLPLSALTGSLKYSTGSLETTWPTDLLPPSLESLVINNCDKESLLDLYEVAKRPRSELPPELQSLTAVAEEGMKLSEPAEQVTVAFKALMTREMASHEGLKIRYPPECGGTEEEAKIFW